MDGDGLTESSRQLRIATWNLMRARPGRSARTRALVALMERVAADIWVLTETHRDLSPGPAYTCVAYSADAPDRDSASGECWVAIWSRLPAEPVTLEAEPARTAAARVNTGGRQTLQVVGTVLPWLSDRRNLPLRGAAAFCDSLGRQAAEWRRLRASEPESILCVAGDFNQDLATRHFYGSAAGRAGLRQALRDAGLVCVTAGSGDSPESGDGYVGIDHICVSEWLVKARLSRTIPLETLPMHGNRLTDHEGVCVEISVEGPARDARETR